MTIRIKRHPGAHRISCGIEYRCNPRNDFNVSFVIRYAEIIKHTGVLTIVCYNYIRKLISGYDTNYFLWLTPSSHFFSGNRFHWQSQWNASILVPLYNMCCTYVNHKQECLMFPYQTEFNAVTLITNEFKILNFNWSVATTLFQLTQEIVVYFKMNNAILFYETRYTLKIPKLTNVSWIHVRNTLERPYIRPNSAHCYLNNFNPL